MEQRLFVSQSGQIFHKEFRYHLDGEKNSIHRLIMIGIKYEELKRKPNSFEIKAQEKVL